MTGADMVILATGMVSNNELAETLMSQGGALELHLFGDCKMPRKIQDAIYEAAVCRKADIE